MSCRLLPAILWRIQPVFAQWPLALVPMLSAIAVAGAVAGLVRRWAAARNWSDVHQLAIVSGAVISHSLIGAVIFTSTTFDRIGITVLGLTLLSMFAIRVRQQTHSAIAPARWKKSDCGRWTIVEPAALVDATASGGIDLAKGAPTLGSVQRV